MTRARGWGGGGFYRGDPGYQRMRGWRGDRGGRGRGRGAPWRGGHQPARGARSILCLLIVYVNT